MRNWIIGLAAIAAAGGASAQMAGSSIWQGVYAADQAARGAAVYAAHCAACHGVALNGTDEAPGLAGGEFVSHWDTLTMGDLFDRVRTTMPQNAPQSLTIDEYADVLAYMLKYNGFPQGEKPLDHRSEVLGLIGITAHKPEAGGK